MKLFVACFCSMVLFLCSFDAFARSKPKKVREKDHPNYERYINDDEFREGRSKRLSGILLSSIGGGTGAAAFIIGILWNSCYGASEKDRPTCQRNARNTMGAGLLVGGASLGFGIPMISAGGEKIGEARRRIDEKYPVREEKQSDRNEANLQKSDHGMLVSAKPFYEDFSISVRFLNLEF
jgi:hypothetical protein